MEHVNSFDIFDTLIARKVRDPTDIFSIIERTFPYPNYKQLRITAQSRSNHTIDDIYRQFKSLTHEEDAIIEKLRECEITTEMENTIPIVSNILKVKDNDLLVSDMYLSPEEIMRILHYHNFDKNINLFVSPGGKANGDMWERLHKLYTITSHCGDNYHSDVIMPGKYGINGIHTNIHAFTALEGSLLDRDIELCTLMRTFRLANPYNEQSIEYKIYDQQAQYNIPLLLFMCRQLGNILQRENRNTVLFLSRDGCLIYKLFAFLYPAYKSVYLYSSRIINNHYTADYVEYLKHHYTKDDCILFDLHGSFSSGRKLFMETFGHLPRIFIFDLSTGTTTNTNITYMTALSNRIEQFNQDMTGSLIDFKEGVPINMPTEISVKYIETMHNTVDKFIAYLKYPDAILRSNSFDDTSYWCDYYKYIIAHSDVILNNIAEHVTHTLTELANYYMTDKGSTYKCAHHYTLKYQEIISSVLYNNRMANKVDNISLLEIGLNRDNVGNIPSLLLWNDYFYGNIDLTGFDIEPSFLSFNSLYNNISIMIGDQSNPQDLAQLTCKSYDIIIDDGYHASKHQQISFKTLWSNVKPGGYYIIEDLHYQPVRETCVKTKELLEHWHNNVWMTSEYISEEDILQIKDTIEFIDLSNSHSKIWGDSVKNALACIKKRI